MIVQAKVNRYTKTFLSVHVYKFMYTCVYIDYILQESHNEKYDADSKEIEAPTKYPLHSLQNKT